MALSVVEVPEEVVEAVVVAHVVEITAEVVVKHQFAMDMVTLLVGFPTEEQLLDQKQLC